MQLTFLSRKQSTKSMPTAAHIILRLRFLPNQGMELNVLTVFRLLYTRKFEIWSEIFLDQNIVGELCGRIAL